MFNEKDLYGADIPPKLNTDPREAYRAGVMYAKQELSQGVKP